MTATTASIDAEGNGSPSLMVNTDHFLAHLNFFDNALSVVNIYTII